MSPDRAQIAAALAVAAALVARDGAAHLPAFLRLESALRDFDKTDGAIQRARALAAAQTPAA